MREAAWERDEGSAPKLGGELRSAFGIREEIDPRVRSGTWAPGERLTSEHDLAEHFATTHGTPREAPSMLGSEGRLDREDRRGWFVAPPRLVCDPIERGTFERVAGAGRVPVTRLLAVAVVPCSARVPALLATPVGSPIRRIRRRRFLDGRAVLPVEHSLRPDAFPGLRTADPTESTTEIHERDYGFCCGGMVFEIITMGSHPAAAEALRMAVDSPGLPVTRAHGDRVGGASTATSNMGATTPSSCGSRPGSRRLPSSQGHPT